MISTKLLRLAACLLLLFIVGGCSQQDDTQNDAKGSAAQSRTREISNASRLKKLTAAFGLSTEQQQQVKALLVAENQEVDKIHEEGTRSGNFDARRIIDARDGTYQKIKALLTPAQLDKFEEKVNKLEGQPKRKAGAWATSSATAA